MAKKTRIDRRGKIRSIVKPWSFTKNKPHWSITKRAAVNRRRRIVDEVWHTDNVTVTDAIVPHLERFITEILSLSDVANINGEKIIINSQVVTDTGGISKNFQQPANASGISLSDSVGFELGTLSSVFNTGKVNDMLFNAVGYDQEFLTDSITAGDAVTLNASTAEGDIASVSDSIGFDFLVGSMLNSSVINLSQFNS